MKTFLHEDFFWFTLMPCALCCHIWHCAWIIPLFIFSNKYIPVRVMWFQSLSWEYWAQDSLAIHSQGKFRVASIPTGMFGRGKKQENPEEAHMNMARACKTSYKLLGFDWRPWSYEVAVLPVTMLPYTVFDLLSVNSRSGKYLDYLYFTKYYWVNTWLVLLWLIG